MHKSDQPRDINPSPRRKALNAAPDLDLGVSQEPASLFPAKACRRIGERWNEDNRKAISEYNSRIAREGLPLEKYRTF
jgi:antitoxin CcdA